jgi:hypothetical protein
MERLLKWWVGVALAAVVACSPPPPPADALEPDATIDATPSGDGACAPGCVPPNECRRGICLEVFDASRDAPDGARDVASEGCDPPCPIFGWRCDPDRVCRPLDAGTDDPGPCTASCDPTQTCAGSRCFCGGDRPTDCPWPTRPHYCVDTQTNGANCGGCGMVCGAGENPDGGAGGSDLGRCVAGTCVCPAGRVLCPNGPPGWVSCVVGTRCP